MVIESDCITFLEDPRDFGFGVCIGLGYCLYRLTRIWDDNEEGK